MTGPPGRCAARTARPVDNCLAEDLETGGHLWAREPARTRSADVILSTGAGTPGQLHGPRSLKLPREEDARAQMPDWLHPESLVAVGDWHLHPSAGSGTPSQADIDMTRQVLAALAQVNITVHDHIIVGRNRHASFKTQKLI